LDVVLRDDYSNHWSVGQKDLVETVLEAAEGYSDDELVGKTIIEKDGKRYVETTHHKAVYGYRLFRE